VIKRGWYPEPLWLRGKAIFWGTLGLYTASYLGVRPLSIQSTSPTFTTQSTEVSGLAPSLFCGLHHRPDGPGSM